MGCTMSLMNLAPIFFKFLFGLLFWVLQKKVRINTSDFKRIQGKPKQSVSVLYQPYSKGSFFNINTSVLLYMGYTMNDVSLSQ